MSSQILMLLVMLVIGYLIGSIPTAYLAGKWIKGIDLREYGSGTVSASMVWEHVAKWALFPVGIFDILKGAIPIWISLALNLSVPQAVWVGLAAVLGHNWSIFLKFHGGRGLSPFLGILFVLFPRGFLVMLVALALGLLLDISAPLTLIVIMLLPWLANLWNALGQISVLSTGMVVITLVKRLEANQRSLPVDKKKWAKVLLLRIIFDRDILDHQEWLQRTPDDTVRSKEELEKTAPS